MPYLSTYTKGILALFVGLALIALIAEQQSASLLILFVLVLLVVPYGSTGARSYKEFEFPILLFLILVTFFPLALNLLFLIVRADSADLTAMSWKLALKENLSSLFTTGADMLSIWRTIEFSLIAVVIEVSIGALIGYRLSRLPKSLDVVRTLFVLPVLIPPLISGMLWRSIFDWGFGMANQILVMFDAQRVVWLSLSAPGIFDPSLERLLNLRSGMACSLVAEVWQWTPLVALVVSASLRTVPQELIQWGRTQGASSLAMIRRIYVPYILPAVSVVGFIRFIDCIKTYETIWTLFGNNSETASATIRIATYVTEVRNYSHGATLSIVFVAIVSGLIFASLRRVSQFRRS